MGRVLFDWIGPMKCQVSQLLLLVEGFLQVVLANVTHAGCERFADGFGGLGLAHREQANCREISLRGLRRLTDTHTDLCNILCYRGHYLRLPPERFCGLDGGLRRAC